MLTLKDIQSIDKSNMYLEIKNMYSQVKKSLEMFDNFKFSVSKSYSNIIINGMGGSAIGAEFVSSVLKHDLNIPIYINRSYNLPNWVNNNTLVIVCSYSGNTEETISCYKECISKKNRPLIISSGGFLLSEAKKHSFNYMQLIPGIQPRAAFGYSSAFIFLALIKFKLLSSEYLNKLNDASISMKRMSDQLSLIEPNNQAIELASNLYNNEIIIYGTPLTDVVSYRFRGQLAENSKVLASHHCIPEQNHNEIEGFTNQNNSKKVIVWIYDNDDHDQIKKRIKITSKLLKNIKGHSFYCHQGNDYLTRLYKNILFFDWVSFYLSILYKQNPTPVNKIHELKEMMSK